MWVGSSLVTVGTVRRTTPRRATAVGRRARVLVVDDEPDILDTIASSLPLFFGPGLELEAASSGAEAQEKVARGGYDVVVSDERMPGMTGIQLLAWLREHHPQVRRVLMTAYNEPGLRERAVQQAGVALFVVKPFALDGFAEQLRELLLTR